MSAIVRVSVQADDFDVSAETSAMGLSPTVGAVVAFTGLCRDEGGTLAGLEIEHYPGMAEAEIARIAAMAVERWRLTAITVVHRHGQIAAGDRIVLVLAAAAHRAEAFAAAGFVMDYLKTDAPFWKRERRTNGSIGPWIAPKATDETARSAWDR